MADVSRSVYLSRKFSTLSEDTSKHVYDGIFSAPATTKPNASSFAARIDDYRDIFPPSTASLGSTIPILDLPAGDRTLGVSSDFDYAGVFGGLGDNDGIEVATEKFFSGLKKSVKREAHPPRIPVPTRRVPSKSQEFSFNNGNDQISSPEKMKRMPSKSQEFSCNYGSDQTLGPAQERRVPSKSQEFVSNHGNDQTSSSAQARRTPSLRQEVLSNNVIDQTSSPGKTSKLSSESQEYSGYPGNNHTPIPAQTRRIPSKSQEFPCNHGNEQTPTPAQTRRKPAKSQEFSCHYENDEASTPAQPKKMPSKSQEFSSHYGNDEASSPVQPRRMPSKSQEFSLSHGNDQMSRPPQLRKQYSQSQEFPGNLSTNQMPTSPVQTKRAFLSNEGDSVSGTSPNVPTSASVLPHETVDSVKHVSFSYNKTNQLGIDSSNGMTHIAHLHAVPGYTHVFDETGPVRKPSFDKAKRLSMDDADFSAASGKVSRQGKHLRTVSDLGTIQQARDLDKPQIRSMSMSNSPQSFGNSGYYKRSSRRRTNRSTNNQENIAYANPFLLLEEELDVNSTAAVSAAAVKRAIEEAEVKIRWAKEFLKDLEGNGFIKPTLKDSFKVNFKSDDHSCNTYGIKQNGSMKAKLTRQKKYINEERILKQNSSLNSNVSVGNCHATEAGEGKPSQKPLQNEATGLEQALHVPSAGVDNMRSPAPENFEETNSHHEFKVAEKSCKDESGGEWEPAKHLSQLFTGVKNRFVSFMSKQADIEKTVIQKDVQSNYEFVEQSIERPQEVLDLNNNRERDADLDYAVGMKHSTFYPAGKTAQDSFGTSVDVEICKEKDHELSTVGSTSSPDTEVLNSNQCRLFETEEEVECTEAHGSANDVQKDISTEVEGELRQEVREQNQEILDEKVKIQNENQMGSTVPEECVELLENDKVKNQEYNKETGDVVPGLEPDETGFDGSLNKEAVTIGQIEGCNLTEIEMPKDAQRKQEIRMVEETSMVVECCEARLEEEETCDGKEGKERIVGHDECLTEVVNDDSKHDECLADTDELFLSRNQEAVPDTVPVEPKEDFEQPDSVQRASELNGSACEQTPCFNDVVDDDSEHDEYLPAVDDILEQDEILSLSRNEEASEHDTVSQYAIDLDLPPQEERLKEATSGIFEHEGNCKRPRSVEMTDQLDEECNSDISVSDIEGADESSEQNDDQPTADDVCEKDEDSCLNRNTETSVPEENLYAQVERAYFENERMPTGGKMENDLTGEMTETSMSAGDVPDLDLIEKETKEVDHPNPSIDIDITECDSALKFEQKLSDEDDESEVSTREANEVANEHSDLSNRRRRWFVSRDEVVKFQQPGILQGNERAMELDQEIPESLAVKDRVKDCLAVKDRVKDCVDEIVTNSGEQADGEGDELQSTEGSHRRRRWFENSGESVQLKPSFVNPVGVTAVTDHEVAQELEHDVNSETVDEKLVNKSKDIADEMESVNTTSDKAGHRRRRWFENEQKLEDPDTTKQELHETSSSSESANTQQSEEQSKAREKEKERRVVEKAIREARQRAFADAKERANAVKTAASIQDKAAMDAKLRAERAAVERATTEARERALQKSMSEKVIYKSREKVEFKNLNTGPSSSGNSTSVPFTSDRPSGATESPQRRKAISERNKRTTERAAKALEEKNMRDVLAQKEQAERNRFSGVLDAEVKRWSTGKEGNLRSLLSTLQYVLGPDSGWQPIPLTDLVTTTAVRKAYKRAALCVHPDKLQQRRATIQQKYICEKVFDLLKDAWHKFNPDDR